MIDSIVAPATIPGTGAISIIRLSGPGCFSIADAVVQLKSGTISEAKPYTIHFGEVYQHQDLLDEVLVAVFRAPHSYTGEDSVEISTHASSYIVTELIRLLQAAGARLAEPGEFTRRAFLNGKLDLSQAEAVADLISSTTEASHRVAMHQFRGSYSSELRRLREELLQMASLLELELDFSEEDVEFAGRGQLQKLVAETRSHIQMLVASFRQGNLLKKGIPVAIVGAPNAGKSTLLNALLADDRAIISDIPGTTRDSIEDQVDWNGRRFRFIDTAGIRSTQDTIEQLGIQRSLKAAADAEILLVVLDGRQDENALVSGLQELLSQIHTKGKIVYILLNKADLLEENDCNKIVMRINNYVTNADNETYIALISAKYGNGLEKLKSCMLASLDKRFPLLQATFVTNERHLTALKEADTALSDVANGLASSLPSDLVAEDLRRSLSSINSILGIDLGLDAQTVLNRIFQSHCIGK